MLYLREEIRLSHRARLTEPWHTQDQALMFLNIELPSTDSVWFVLRWRLDSYSEGRGVDRLIHWRLRQHNFTHALLYMNHLPLSASSLGWVPGTTILGRYEMVRVLGRGAMGEVWEVKDKRGGLSYALKRVPPEVAKQPTQLSSIRENFQLVSRLTHPHIAVTRFLELDESTGDVFILMDLIQGCNLSSWLNEQRKAKHDPQSPLPLSLALGIAEQIATALDYAHSQPSSVDADGSVRRFGILHRDLKPENVMVETGRWYRSGVPSVKVVDFGLAAEVQSSLGSKTQFQENVNTVMGTPLYMAPEQWQGRRLSRAIDQWALAVMIYEMVEGVPPFYGISIPDLREQVMQGAAHTPENMTKAQWQALQVALHPDRTQRYRSCVAFVQQLAHADPLTRGSVQAIEIPLPEFTSDSSSSVPQTPVAPAAELNSTAQPTQTVPLGASSPTPFDIPVAPPRRKFPLVQGLLGVGLVVGVVAFIHSQQQEVVIPPASTPAKLNPPIDPPSKLESFVGKQAGQERTDNGLQIKFCWCPPGSYVMGVPPGETAKVFKKVSREQQQVQVTLTHGFWMGKYEVTQAQWQQVMSTTVEAQRNLANPNGEIPAIDGQLPMYYVNYDEVVEFCRRFTTQEQKAGRLPAGWEYRLPTEAQWEYACRAGTTTAWSFGDTINSHQANFDGNFPPTEGEVGPYLATVTPGGDYPANAWGLHDMHANVSE